MDISGENCTIFNTLEEESFVFCRDFSCYGGGFSVSEVFSPNVSELSQPPKIAEMVFHSFSIIYFHLVKYLHPNRVIEMDVPADIIENLEPFTDATWTCSPPTPVRLTGVGNYMTALRRLKALQRHIRSALARLETRRWNGQLDKF